MTEIQLTSKIAVEEVQQVGSDEMIVRMMLQSTDKAGIELDEQGIAGRLRYLLKSRHGGPLEHGSLTVRVHTPAKVWWEWVRHRVGWSYSLESSRYTDLEPIFYLPSPDRPMIRPEGFKSARPAFATVTDLDEYQGILDDLQDGYRHAYQCYLNLLGRGVDRGLAMLVLGQAVYFTGSATANPRSILHFLELRTDHPEAKRPSKPLYEIRVAADQLEAIFARHWPLTHRAWVEHGRMAP
jgi:thymidylate synthase (FAD)